MAKAESCHNCVYAHWDLGLWARTMRSGFPARPTCGNQPDFPGRMRECPLGPVCRNFRAKPPTPTGETVKTIPLGDGFYAYVDAADYEWLSQWTWHLYNGYAGRREKGKLIFMHRQIARPPKGMVVDHHNRNRMDNTRANLRVCTPQENGRNKGKRAGASSRFVGVFYCKASGKWRAHIWFEGGYVSIGYFTDEVEAARAYDRKAVELFGATARLNFPEEWPPQRRKRVYARFHATLKKDGEKGAKSAKGVKGQKAARAGKAGAKRKMQWPRATPASSRAARDKAWSKQ
jgi:hypothetical protein